MKIAGSISVLFVVGFIVLTTPFQLYGQEAGIIEQIHGSAYWKEDLRSRAIRLDPQRDKGRLLRAGERLRCDRGAELRLRLYGRIVRWISSSWFPIPYTSPDNTNLRSQVILTYGSRGGGDRGATSIYSPSSLGRVRPGTFEIRWIPKPGLRVVSLLIREASPSGHEILRQNIAARISGHVRSETARQALLKYRTERGHGPLLLVLLGEREEIDRTTFFLVSARDEESLDQELRVWDQEPEGLWRHLARAHSFVVHEMFTEAADEYEAALRHAPAGTDLLRRTITAHQRTGNVAREKQLYKRLPKRIRLSHEENKKIVELRLDDRYVSTGISRMGSRFLVLP